MATQVKFTAKRGGRIEDVTQGAGTTISGSDAIELNVDVDKMTQGDFIVALDTLKAAVITRLYPAT